MTRPLDIQPAGAIDLLALGALVHRLDPGVVPFRKATSCSIHVSGGEFNCAANLADCFGLRTAIATAMVEYPIGDLIAERVRAMGVHAVLQDASSTTACSGPNMATVYSDRGFGVRGPVVFYNRSNEAAAQLKPGDFDWKQIFGGGVRWFHSGGIFAALSATTAELIIEAMQAAKAHGAVVSFDLNYREKLWRVVGRRRSRRLRARRASSSTSTCWSATKRTCRRGSAIAGTGGRRDVEARSQRLLRHDRPRRREVPEHEGRRDDAARGALDQPPQLGRGRLDRRPDLRRRRPASSTSSIASAAATASRPDSSTGCSPASRRSEAVRLGWAHGALLTTFPGDTTMATLDRCARSRGRLGADPALGLT